MNRNQILERAAAAQILGNIAFKNGSKCVAGNDTELMKLLEGVQVGNGAPILKAWIRGWTEANLAAPIE